MGMTRGGALLNPFRPGSSDARTGKKIRYGTSVSSNGGQISVGITLSMETPPVAFVLSLASSGLLCTPLQSA